MFKLRFDLPSGALPRHFFLWNVQAAPAFASIVLNAILLIFLWTQSISGNPKLRLSTRSHNVILINTNPNSQYVQVLPSTKSLQTSSLKAENNTAEMKEPDAAGIPPVKSAVISSQGLEGEVSSFVTGSESATTSPAQEPEPKLTSVEPSENSSFALPSRLNLSIPSRRRNVFEPLAGSGDPAHAHRAAQTADQAWQKQKAQQDLRSKMIINLISDLNKEAKPAVVTTCELRPQLTCSINDSPALAVLRRYAGFFADTGVQDNIFVSYRDGLWSVDIKPAQ